MTAEISKLHIEKLAYKDVDKLAQIFSEEFQTEPAFMLVQQRFKRLKQFYHLLYPLRKISLTIANLFNLYLIKYEEHIIGFIQVTSIATVQLHIDFFAISRPYQNKGFGSRSLQLFSRNLDKNLANYLITLEVKTNTPAAKLYQKVGFETAYNLVQFEMPVQQIFTQSPAKKQFEFTTPTINDYAKIQTFYNKIMPRTVSQTAIRTTAALYFQYWFGKVKNKIMHYEKEEFVLYEKEQLIACLEIYHYPHADLHTIHLVLHADYERLRCDILKQAFAIIIKKFSEGTVSMTIFGGSPGKEQAATMLGFKCIDIYQFMRRFSSV
jgi:ribosomal protein S18 acetylase RimI-like enzyme